MSLFALLSQVDFLCLRRDDQAELLLLLDVNTHNTLDLRANRKKHPGEGSRQAAAVNVKQNNRLARGTSNLHRAHQPIAQVYIRASPLPELPEALFLALFAAAGGYSLNRRLCLLERLDRRAPDSVALMCGVATLLRQFHPCYGEVCRACVTVVTLNPKTQLLPAPALPSRDARATWCQGCLTSCLRW